MEAFKEESFYYGNSNRNIDGRTHQEDVNIRELTAYRITVDDCDILSLLSHESLFSIKHFQASSKNNNMSSQTPPRTKKGLKFGKYFTRATSISTTIGHLVVHFCTSSHGWLIVIKLNSIGKNKLPCYF